jgi:hypothetical protein
MRLLSQLLLAISVIILASCSSGQEKEFAKIQYASFDVNSYRTPQKDTPFIALYAEVEADGQIHIYDDNEYKNQTNNTTVKLSKTQLDSLKAIFNSTDKLTHHLKEYQFQSGKEFFAGSYDFYTVIYKNGIKDTICTIQPFMDEKLEKIHVMLEDLYYGDTRQKIGDLVKPTSIFIKSLYKAFSSNKLLPPIQNPPAFRLEDNPQ